MARGDLQSLRSLLPGLLGKVARESGRAKHLWPLWREAVGEPIARAARPLTLEGGVLTVAAVAPEWAAELSRQEPEIVRRLGESLGTGLVRSLRVTVPPSGLPGEPVST